MSLKLKITFDRNHVGQIDHIDHNEQKSDNSCDDTNDADEENGATSLKRKRLCDIAYTSEKIFDSYHEAVQYVDSQGLWKFERNRPTKKGSKGFYHCKLSDECKAKIYLLSDPFSSRVVLYQNNVDHDHSCYGQLSNNKRPMVMVKTLKEETNEIDNEEAEEIQPVEIVNDDDFEDSLVDFEDYEENKTSKYKTFK